MEGGAAGEMIETSSQRFAAEGDGPNAVAADLIGQNGGMDADDARSNSLASRLCSTSRIEV